MSSPLIEYQRTEPHTLNGIVRTVSWPVVVHSRRTAGTSAGPELWNELHVLVCLLTAVFGGGAWQVRSAPVPAGRWLTAVPQSWPAPPGWHESPEREPGGQPSVLPSGFGELWLSAVADSRGSRPLRMWHQAVLAHSTHPTLALLGYVASVEAAARRLGPYDGGGEGFRAVIDRYCDDAKDGAVLKRLYRDRGSASHGSRLLGPEGAWGQSLWDVGSPAGGGEAAKLFEFSVVTLGRLRSVARVAALEAAMMSPVR